MGMQSAPWQQFTGLLSGVCRSRGSLTQQIKSACGRRVQPGSSMHPQIRVRAKTWAALSGAAVVAACVCWGGVGCASM
eukprot:364225-Chlamydomonas_euryale.AAC.1